MAFKYFLLFVFVWTGLSLSAQERDSTQLIQDLTEFDIVDKASAIEYYKLLFDANQSLPLKELDQFAQKGIDNFQQMGLDSLAFITAHGITRNFISKRSYGNKALQYALIMQEASEKFSLNGDAYLTKGMASNYVGIAYDAISNSYQAIKYYALATEYFKKSNNPNRASLPLNNLSMMHSKMGDYNKAVKYLRYGLPLAQQQDSLDKVYSLSLIYFNMSQNFKELNQLDSLSYYMKAFIEINKSLDNAEQLRFKQAYYNNNLSLAGYFITQEKWEEAKKYLDKALPFKHYYSMGYEITEFNYCLNSLRCKDLDSRYQKLLDQESTIPKYSHPYFLILQASYFEKTRQYQKALVAKQKVHDNEKERLNQISTNYAAYVDAQFENSLNQEQITQLKLDNQIKKNQSIRLTIGFVFSGLLSAFIYYFWYQSKQKNKLLQKDIENKEFIEQQSTELKRVDLLKSKLFTNISHELRTPLTLITGPIDYILKRYELKEADKKQLLLAQKNSRQLLEISNQIMELTKSEIGQISLDIARFHFNGLLGHLLPSFYSMAENKGLIFRETKEYTNHILLQTDLVKLKTIVSNLLQNAIKYNKEGGAIVLTSKDLGGHIAFSVKDTGIGIAQSELPSVFNRYYQSKNRTEAEGGFGIGLAICQEYVQLLGGAIEITSKLGVGTTVSVKLPKIIGETDAVPLYEFDNQLSINTPVPLPTTKSNGPKNHATHLLIVEDHEDLRQFLQTTLSPDYTLTFATNGSQALTKLENIAPNLIITDWMMPIMNGLEFIQKIKEQPKLKHIPLLMLTARSLPIDQLKAFQKGVDDYLLKPFEIDNLKLRIEHLLDFAQGRKEATSSNDESYQTALTEAHSTPSIQPTQQLKSQNQKGLKWICKVEEIIQNHIGDFNLNLQIISAEIDMSTVHLNRKIKAITGLTPMKFINEIRFWEARRLLEEKKELSVKALAYSVGFKSVKNFSRNFKKRFGFYPSEYLD